VLKEDKSDNYDTEIYNVNVYYKFVWIKLIQFNYCFCELFFLSNNKLHKHVWKNHKKLTTQNISQHHCIEHISQ